MNKPVAFLGVLIPLVLVAIGQFAYCIDENFTITPTPNYESTVVADGLFSPSNVAIDPVSNRLFFVQAHKYDLLFNTDPADKDAQHRAWESVGSEEAVYELRDGKISRLCDGAGDTWGGVHFTQITCGYNGEIFVHGSTWIDEQIACCKIDTPNRYVFWLNFPFGKFSGQISKDFGGFAVSPIDKALYIFNTKEIGIDNLGTDNKSLVNWLKTDQLDPDAAIMFDGMTVDKSGNFYLFHAEGWGETRKKWIDVVKPDKTTDKLFVQDATEVVGKKASATGGAVIRYNPASNSLVSIGSIDDEPRKDGGMDWHWAIFSISLTDGKVALIAQINNYNGNIFDLEVDGNGNIFIPLSFASKIIKISPKNDKPTENLPK